MFNVTLYATPANISKFTENVPSLFVIAFILYSFEFTIP